MRFTVAALIFMYIGRKIGWVLSRAVLYSAGKPVVIAACIVWGALVALVIHGLIVREQPNLIVKIIFGFGLGVYVSIPNFGLVREDTIPDHAQPRHTLISLLPIWIFLAASACLAFLR